MRTIGNDLIPLSWGICTTGIARSPVACVVVAVGAGKVWVGGREVS